MKTVYVVYASDVLGEEKEVHSIGSTKEVAQKIAEKDRDDGQIAFDFFIQPVIMYERIDEV